MHNWLSVQAMLTLLFANLIKSIKTARRAENWFAPLIELLAVRETVTDGCAGPGW